MNRYGLPDEIFIRDKVPMTKSEIRALTLIKLDLNKDDIVWDVGAGTGSISIEAALNVPAGRVLAIEKNIEAVELIKANKEKFKCQNLEVVHGVAPDIFPELTKPTKAIIGGSTGNLQEIIHYLWYKTSVQNLVINAITLNTTYLALEVLNSLQGQIDAIQIALNKIKMVNGYQMLQSQNPVFIISATKQEE
ncbi:MAG: precorrin-6B C5,15-methyltransferase / cobalt-precorrin-6B C5,C15-methyltransferase [Clostridia bacterium]|jgi:precorrin-6Y C5,15-methyltransferase (decarboxylating)|nr:precorrin-6B C5,15-methyltransferase / cobalt-precorrin-6B C5,C15-methyltransferase [Clostridia bacterium]MDN5323942.1 precorrin-6B C5,15-methyltransferase / cobalt-precorrin-6B C5,C15-methyltransferase [Clostridia bacterium]